MPASANPSDSSALARFAEALGVDSPTAAMRFACEQLRQRVREAGWLPGLDAYVRAFGLRVEEGPIPTAGRLDYESGQYVVRVQRTRHRGERAAETASSKAARPSSRSPLPPTELRVSDATNRQRFTIAHEIGHAILIERLSPWPEALAGLREPLAWAEIEALCDVAAGDLLVPLDQFLPLVGRLGISVRGLERLADRFRVALEVIYERLLATGVLSISVWRVSAAAEANEDIITLVRVVASLTTDDTGTVAHIDAASRFTPSLVRRAAQHGHAQSDQLIVWNGDSRLDGAGIAMCHAPHGSRSAQPSLLGGSVADAAASDTLVTLLLLRTDAPLWGTLAE
jgi:hypothetical protein